MADDNTKDDQFLNNNSDDTNPIDNMKRGEKLSEDNDTPFSPPDDVKNKIDDTAPSTDTNMDKHELYNADLEAASGVEVPSSANGDNKDLPLAA